MEKINLFNFLSDKTNFIFTILLNRISPFITSDKLYLKLRFRLRMGYWIDFNKPITFNEKLNWLKLYDRKDIYTTMVDKAKAKDYVAKIIGSKYIVPTLGVWDKVEDIDWDNLPEQFVLKVTHDSGGVSICKDKKTFNKEVAINKIIRALKHDYYKYSREWPYKNVERKILAEKYLGENLQDYRIYCFNGEAKLIYSYTNVSEEDGSKPEPSYCDIFDREWNPMPFRQKSPARGNIERPQHLDEMIKCAEKIAKDIPHVRVDFYEKDQVYIGELTFYAGSGMSKFNPDEWDKKLGNWLVLPNLGL